MKYFDLVRKGLHRPYRIPGWVYDNFIRSRRYQAYRKLKRLDSQAQLIEDFIGKEEFCLVILDACRYDVFEQEISDHLSGELTKIWSTASWTREWLQQTWESQYDLTYVSGNAHTCDEAFERVDRDYRPSQHFDHVVNVWSHDLEMPFGVVEPEMLTNSVLTLISGDSPQRLVVHYNQPHTPYVGDVRIPPSTHSDYEVGIMDRVKNGELSEGELREAYRANLKCALESVERLARHLSAPTIITADHGELLGEGGKFGHPTIVHPVLRMVPWFEVGSNHLRGKSPTHQESTVVSEEATSEIVEERLSALGYQ